MSEANDFSKMRIAAEVAAGAFRVRRDVPYADGTLTMDIYEPAQGAGRGVVVIVEGYRDAGLVSFIGCRFKEMGWTVSWAELLASAGTTVVTYTNEEPMDVERLLGFLKREAASLSIDGGSISLLACSGHGPVALSLLRRDAAVSIRRAAILYGYTLDLPGSTAVAAAAQQFRFANPSTSVDELRTDAPIMIVRAGADQTPGLNEALDAFAAAALRRDMPLSLVNVPGTPHAFDMLDRSTRTREVIAQVASFLTAAPGIASA